ncbi:MAG TPA: NAD(P)-dependent oxidoreductase, partial [Terriglobales bacterium]|nr:NAD(P)-dependent oxidoreductase [Terriglobales bacterium]
MGAPRILLTGAAGLVGRSMLSELRSRGTDCLPTDRTARISIPELVTGDLGDKAFLDGLFGAHTFTCIIHLAGMLLTAARQDPVRATQINIDASIGLIERARSAGVERFVFASSLGVYGGRFGPEPVDERSPAAPEGL